MGMMVVCCRQDGWCTMGRMAGVLLAGQVVYYWQDGWCTIGRMVVYYLQERWGSVDVFPFDESKRIFENYSKVMSYDKKLSNSFHMVKTSRNSPL